MDEMRCNPEEILRQIKKEEASESGRGRLKIFFGYAAGVGKTYTMLKEAHELKNQGIDVVAGYVEPHARPQTAQLLHGLEVLPTRPVPHGGITLQ